MNRVTHWGPIVLFIGNAADLLLEEKKKKREKKQELWLVRSDISNSLCILKHSWAFLKLYLKISH